MAEVDTLPEIYRPMMGRPSLIADHCPVCGRSGPLEQHHPVRRGAGRLYRHGIEVRKPTITLCGFGNNLADADGRPYCHGLAHANRLHFRWVEAEVPVKDSPMDGFSAKARFGGHWEYRLFPEPVKYQDALSKGGWRRLAPPERIW